MTRYAVLIQKPDRPGQPGQSVVFQCYADEIEAWRVASRLRAIGCNGVSVKPARKGDVPGRGRRNG